MSPPTILTMKIDRIEASKHKRGRVLVFLADGGSLLKVTEQELLTFGLRAGDELDAETLGAAEEGRRGVQHQDHGGGPHWPQGYEPRDLEKKLQEKGATEAEARYAGEWLEAIGAIDDAAYAAALCATAATGATAPGGRRRSSGKKGCPRISGTRLWMSCRRTESRSTTFCRGSSVAGPRRTRRKNG